MLGSFSENGAVHRGAEAARAICRKGWHTRGHEMNLPDHVCIFHTAILMAEKVEISISVGVKRLVDRENCNEK
jgi:hypothetical protein